MPQQIHSLGSDYTLPSEPECIEIGHHAHHHTNYASGGVQDHHLRRDGALSQPANVMSIQSTNNNMRYIPPHRPGHDPVYQSGSGISDSSSGSISTSPSSNSSSIPFPSCPPPSLYSHQQPALQLGNSFTTAPHLFSNQGGFPNSYARGKLQSLPANFKSPRTDHSPLGMLPPSRTTADHQVSPSLSATARYTTAAAPFANRHNSFSHNPLSPRHHAEPYRGYGSIPDTPRTIVANSNMSGQQASYGAGMGMYSSHNARSEDTPPFGKQENIRELTCDGQSVNPIINCKIEKGFFISGETRTWTCYRRNYFSVNVSFTLEPYISNGHLYVNLDQDGPPQKVQAMAMIISATVDGTAGKSIELVQHTPKRDKGPQLQIQYEKLAPTPLGKSQVDPHGYQINPFPTSSAQLPGPYLPLQGEDREQPYGTAGHGVNNFSHTFERIQFKSATANNGKRRAQQQYYHLIVELHVDVRDPRESKPRWEKIAYRSSAQVVVRGRSPSHYQNEGPHNSGSRGGSSGSGNGSGPHHPFTGGSVAPPGRGLNTNLTMLGTSGIGGGHYRGSHYSMDPSPLSSHSVSSASSISGGPNDSLVGDQNMMDEDERKSVDNFNGYHYYANPIFEVGLPSPSKDDDKHRRVKEEYTSQGLPLPLSLPGSWSLGYGKYQGTETSREAYPLIDAYAD
ncbi:p53-like transcription factor [Patellaria atrata CBS 101060]|uniref:P53-like transcription factor n=1 Tax=Patellaria atrata CBS 101060 TaxID=1346257 RepID=A0A9P4S555_9PEZI|nr:p53-like transcription factor [Patellaria atrata CBS 101060]